MSRNVSGNPKYEEYNEYRAAHRALAKLEVETAAKFQKALETGDLPAARECVEELNLRVDAFKSLREKLTEQDLFVIKYNIQPLGEHEVSLVLPKDVSRLEFLQDAQRVALAIHGRTVVWPKQLTTWAGENAFTQSASASTPLRIDGNVDGSTNKTREEQVKHLKPHVMPSLEDLVIAHAAFFIATGSNLFQGNLVRAFGGALHFDDDGLHVYDWHDDNCHAFIAAAVALPSRNQTP